MKIGEALSELKKKQNRLKRLLLLRKENVYVEKGKKTNFDPEELTEEINRITNEIRKLKLSIQKTNLQTTVKGEKILLAEAIIKMNDLRSEIDQLSNLFEKKRDLFYREREEKEIVPLLDENDVESRIEELENEKTRLDDEIQITNWSAQLIN